MRRVLITVGLLVGFTCLSIGVTWLMELLPVAVMLLVLAIIFAGAWDIAGDL